MKITAYKAKDGALFEDVNDQRFRDRRIDFVDFYSTVDNTPLSWSPCLMADIIEKELINVRTLVGYDILNAELAVMTEERDILYNALNKATEAVINLPVSDTELRSDKFKPVRSAINEAIAALEAVKI